MIAYQTNGKNEYTGPVECDPDPLAGEDAWLIPGGAVLVSPPSEVAAGYVPVWTGDKWVIQKQGKAVATPLKLAEIAKVKEEQRHAAMLQARRGGFLFRGFMMASDPDSMLMMLAATRRAHDALREGSDEALESYAQELGAGWRGWKPATGVVPVTTSAQDMVQVERAAIMHVRHCDDVGQAHLAALSALSASGDRAGLLAYDPTTGYGLAG